jgi:hypothetical protein
MRRPRTDSEQERLDERRELFVELVALVLVVVLAPVLLVLHEALLMRAYVRDRTNAKTSAGAWRLLVLAAVAEAPVAASDILPYERRGGGPRRLRPRRASVRRPGGAVS